MANELPEVNTGRAWRWSWGADWRVWGVGLIVGKPPGAWTVTLTLGPFHLDAFRGTVTAV